MDKENIAALIACLYAASAHAGGVEWLEKANLVVEGFARDPETPAGAAELLEIVAAIARHANDPIALAALGGH